MILYQTQQRIRRKTLSDLTNDEKGKLYNALNRMIINEVPPKYYEHIPKVLIGDSYTFLLEDPASFLRDGAEFSTAMNACGRNHEEKIAMEKYFDILYSGFDESKTENEGTTQQ